MSQRDRHWKIAPGETPARLDHHLAALLPEHSRSRIQAWIRGGHVRVNQVRVKTGYIIRPGDEISLLEPETFPSQPEPENLPLSILFEDPDLAVVDKPAGMTCHTGAGIRTGTLVNALLYHFGRLDAGDPSRPGIVHRLDKLTSGVLVVARNPRSHRLLSAQFKSRQVGKAYTALVFGQPKAERGTIDLPIGRAPANRKKISVRARRKRAAVTHYRIAERYAQLTLLDITIETGRTHQIRVHLAHLGHPVVGDTLYGGRRSRDIHDPLLRGEIEGLNRYFLHARSLEFDHPRTGKRLRFEAPLPLELQRLLDLLKRCRQKH